MGDRNIIIPSAELTIDQKRRFKQDCLDTGVRWALRTGLADSDAGLKIRDASCALDFGTPLDRWETMPLVEEETWYSVFQSVRYPLMAQNKVAVFYKVGIETVPISVSRLRFRLGPGGSIPLVDYDLEQLINQDALTALVQDIEELRGQRPPDDAMWMNILQYFTDRLARPQEGWFSQPIIFSPGEVVNVEVKCRTATGLPARVQLGCYIIESRGVVVR